MCKIVFIVNPISGGRDVCKKRLVLETLVAKMPKAELMYTEYAGHAKCLATNVVRSGYKIVVAVGGMERLMKSHLLLWEQILFWGLSHWDLEMALLAI